jgi:hypothetical protein
VCVCGTPFRLPLSSTVGATHLLIRSSFSLLIIVVLFAESQRAPESEGGEVKKKKNKERK